MSTELSELFRTLMRLTGLSIPDSFFMRRARKLYRELTPKGGHKDFDGVRKSAGLLLQGLRELYIKHKVWVNSSAEGRRGVLKL